MLAIDIYRNMATVPCPYMYDDFKITVGHIFEQILFTAERDFEINVVERFPYEVQFLPITNDDRLDVRIKKVEKYLRRFPSSMYVAFPGNATGRYMHCAINSVFFKDPNHALITKLAFIG